MAGRTVTIHLGGKDRELRYDLNAISTIGDKLGLEGSLNNLAADILGKPLPLSALRTLLWAGLLWDDKELTEEEVGSWVDLDNFGEVWDRFFTPFRNKLSESAAGKKVLEMATDRSETSDSPTSKTSDTARSA